MMMLFIRHRKSVRHLVAGLLWIALAGVCWATSSEAIQSKLAEARENLRISQATERRIATELDQLKQACGASPDIIRDYEIYLGRVQAMVAENQKIVNEMEAAYAARADNRQASVSNAPDDMNQLSNPTIPEQEPTDEVAALDRELDASLSEFDDLLLKELDKIQAKSAQKMHDLAEEAAAAAKRLREKGVDAEAAAAETASETEAAQEEQTAAAAEKDAGPAPEGGGETERAAKEPSREGSQGTPRDSASHGSPEDDDIVARQLREAAENETDPELKEKLWKEYEEYKKSSRQ